MKTRATGETFERLCNILDNNSKVYYSRFGDGDFNIMNGKRELMHEWSPELQVELRESFAIDDPLYLKGAMVNYPLEEGMTWGVFAPATNNTEIENWLLTNQKVDPETIFDSHIMFHYMSVFKQDLMIEFLDKYIRPKKKMLINSFSPDDHVHAPECHRSFDHSKSTRVQEFERLELLIGKIDHFVEVPFTDAYYKMDEWWPEIEENIDGVELCIPAAGMAGRVVQKRLWNLNKDLHSIDLGAVLDAVAQRSTRTWIDVVGDKVDNLLINNRDK
jgi:hypothetical protein